MNKRILQVLCNSLGTVCKKVQMAALLSATEHKITHAHRIKESVPSISLLLWLHFGQPY